MGKPLMIQIEDEMKIELLKSMSGAKTKIEVIRTALDLYKKDLERKRRIDRWKKAAQIVGGSGLEVLEDFKTSGRFGSLLE